MAAADGELGKNVFVGRASNRDNQDGMAAVAASGSERRR